MAMAHGSLLWIVGVVARVVKAVNVRRIPITSAERFRVDRLPAVGLAMMAGSCLVGGWGRVARAIDVASSAVPRS